MLVLISDLHLPDTVSRVSFDVSKLIFRLRETIRRSSNEYNVKDVTVILLGDVLELLKSDQWLTYDVRPWQASTPKHEEVVAKILEGIIATNAIFFEGLQKVARDCSSFILEYIPGNHDRVINTEMGATARAYLQGILKFRQSKGESFEDHFTDGDIGIIAQHGHEWDLANRYSAHGAALGDAIVIDLLLRLPTMVRDSLGTSDKDVSLKFLHELDHVIPQHPRVMAKWLLIGLDGIKRAYPNAQRTISNSLLSLAEEFKKLIDHERFGEMATASWWLKFLFKMAEFVATKFGTLSTAIRLPGGEPKPQSFALHAYKELSTALLSHNRFRFIVCGHTHRADFVSFKVKNLDGLGFYINTGTWRKVHRIVEIPSETNSLFSTSYEESIVCIFNSTERKKGSPMYEIYRSDRG